MDGRIHRESLLHEAYENYLHGSFDSEKLADLSVDELSNLFYLYLDGKDEFWKKAAMEYVDEYCFENKF